MVDSRTGAATTLSMPLGLVLATLETVINRALRYDRASCLRLAELENRCVAVHIEGLALSVYLQVLDDGIRLSTQPPATPDAELRAPSVALLRTLLSPATTLAPGGDMQILGDTALLTELREIARDADIQWELPLAQVVGDAAAFRIGQSARGLLHFARQGIQTLFQDTSEYLRTDSGHLPERWEVNAWKDDVDSLRADVERIEARLQRFEKICLEKKRMATAVTNSGGRA